jgi:hypothetical protein
MTPGAPLAILPRPDTRLQNIAEKIDGPELAIPNRGAL